MRLRTWEGPESFEGHGDRHRERLPRCPLGPGPHEPSCRDRRSHGGARPGEGGGGSARRCAGSRWRWGEAVGTVASRPGWPRRIRSWTWPSFRSQVWICRSSPWETRTPSKPGDGVTVLGYPFGRQVEVGRRVGTDTVPEPSVTAGSLSAARLDEEGRTRYLQTDASVNPGSSGGPILDEDGSGRGDRKNEAVAGGAGRGGGIRHSSQPGQGLPRRPWASLPGPRDTAAGRRAARAGLEGDPHRDARRFRRRIAGPAARGHGDRRGPGVLAGGPGRDPPWCGSAGRGPPRRAGAAPGSCRPRRASSTEGSGDGRRASLARQRAGPRRASGFASSTPFSISARSRSWHGTWARPSTWPSTSGSCPALLDESPGGTAPHRPRCGGPGRWPSSGCAPWVRRVILVDCPCQQAGAARRPPSRRAPGCPHRRRGWRPARSETSQWSFAP